MEFYPFFPPTHVLFLFWDQTQGLMLNFVIIPTQSVKVPWSFLVFRALDSFEECRPLFYRMSIGLDLCDVSQLEGDGVHFGQENQNKVVPFSVYHISGVYPDHKKFITNSSLHSNLVKIMSISFQNFPMYIFAYI